MQNLNFSGGQFKFSLQNPTLLLIVQKPPVDLSIVRNDDIHLLLQGRCHVVDGLIPLPFHLLFVLFKHVLACTQQVHLILELPDSLLQLVYILFSASTRAPALLYLTLCNLVL